MSKQIEILESRLEELYDNKNGLEDRSHKLIRRKKNEQRLMLGNYFHVNSEKFICQISSDECVRLKYSGDKYGELISYQLNYNWSRDDNGERVVDSKVFHNGSTYETLDENMLNESQARFEFMQCAVDHNDDIIAAWNTIEKKYDKLTETFYKPMKELRESLISQQSDIAKLEKKALRDKLSGKGITFTNSESGKLPELEVRWDWSISRIKTLKVLRMTASGKSADLEITQKSNSWDDNTKSYIDTEATNTYDRVRMDKVEHLIKSAQRNSQLVSETK